MLFNSSSEINAIHLTFTQELELSIKPTDIGVQKIDDIMLNIYRMVVTVFLVIDKANQVRFFEKVFLVANFIPKIMLEIHFLKTLRSASFLED